jgi:hypothetical protein
MTTGNPLDDIFAGLENGTLDERSSTPPASYAPREFVEPCKKCRGSGRFIGWSGRAIGNCFTCKGSGKAIFKTSPETRAAARTSAANSKAAKLEAFKAEFPDVWAWLDGSTFAPAIEMRDALNKYGSLLPHRIEFARRMIAKRDEAKAAKEAERAAAGFVPTTAQAVDSSFLMAAFDKAKAYQARSTRGEAGKRRAPKLAFSDFTVKAAPANGRNAGALYVTHRTLRNAEDKALYLGKVTEGRFVPSRECPADVLPEVLKLVADPRGYVAQFGQRTGICCACGAGLTAAESIERADGLGMGPICAEKFGW